MAIRHGYDRMKIAIISNPENLVLNYSYIKWLPHIWNSKSSRRMIALCEDDIYELESEISNYFHLPQREESGMFLLCIVDDFSYLEKKPLLRWINEKRFGNFLISVIRKENENELPSSCEHFLRLDQNKNATYFDGEIISYDQNNKLAGIDVHYDSLDSDTAEIISRNLSSIQIMDTENTSDIPSMLYFLENEKISSIENFSLKDEWEKTKNNICTCIGTGSENRPVTIDFSDGINIHMIVIGTSGSGKSQFLISMVLDMMLHYSAEEVNFVFMDFKGNAFSSAFSHISDDRMLVYPNHVVGSISNIESDGEYQITRIRIMLKKEISYRESLLSKATENGLIQEARIDLYQQLFKNSENVTVNDDLSDFKPLPELFLIVDEFMELLDSYSSIVSEFNMIARKGRSLGIHLILSAQKMGGRLSPQISANAGTRICFRVIDPSDSTEMIGTDDAYYIDSGMFGRAYFKSGISLQEFQAPLSDTAYLESTAPSFGEVNDYGKIIENTPYKEADTKMTQRQAVIFKICSHQDRLNEKCMVVTELLPETIDITEAFKDIKTSSEIPIGKRDNIYEQCYDTANISFQNGNWVITGISRCGKTNLLSVLLLSAAYYYNDLDYNFFICDLQSTELKKYCRLKNTSEQMIDNIERLTRLVYYLNAEIAKRKASNAVYQKIVVIIDNYDYIVEKYEYILPELTALFSRGNNYDIWFVISHNEKLASYQSRSVDFYNKIVMMQKTENDYSNLIDLRDIKTIRRLPGRGFISGDAVLEMQTFTLPYNPDDEKTLINQINNSMKKDRQSRLEPIEVLQDSLPINTMVKYVKNMVCSSDNCYAGISSKNRLPVAIPLFEKRYLAVTSDNTQARLEFIKTILLLHCCKTEIWKNKKIVVITRNESLKTELDNTIGSASTAGIFRNYTPGQKIPDFCILDLCDITNSDEQNRILKELKESERLVITENYPSYYEALNKIGHDAFFQNFILYFMDIYTKQCNGAWINCLTDSDLEIRNEFLMCKIENQTFSKMLSHDELKNTHLGIEQRITERNLASIDIPYSGIMLPVNQAWLRENGKYSRVLCVES